MDIPFLLKRIEQINEQKELETLFLKIRKLLPVSSIVGNNKLIRIGNPFGDGGYLMLDEFNKKQVAYSFGISNDISWDKDIVSRGIHCYMYDHTIDALPQNSPLFHWYKIGIGGKESVPPFASLESLLLSNGHNYNSNLILKIDVEGAERQALLETSEEVLCQFDQIVVELHNLNELNFSYSNLALLKKLLVTHTPIHVHANNCGSYVEIKDLVMPFALEVTYARNEGRKFKLNSLYYPRMIDVQNNEELPDIILGLWNVPIF